MKQTQQEQPGQRRPRCAAAMPAHAQALGFAQRQHDANDAHAMTVFARLRGAVNPRARLLMLSGLNVNGRA